MKTISLVTVLGFATLCFAASPKIAPKEAAELLSNGEAILVDVRETTEIKESGKAGPAVSLPTSSIQAKDEAYKQFMLALPKDKVIITYCGSGKRAERFNEELLKQGHKAMNMGGFKEWKDAGLPVTK